MTPGDADMSDVSYRAVHRAVTSYIRDNFLYDRSDYPLHDDDRLLDDGIMDSMGAAELVAFLEQRFGVAVPDDEITEDNFGTVTAIATFISQKHANSTPAGD
jgi:acyl carrier protein